MISKCGSSSLLFLTCHTDSLVFSLQESMNSLLDWQNSKELLPVEAMLRCQNARGPGRVGVGNMFTYPGWPKAG